MTSKEIELWKEYRKEIDEYNSLESARCEEDNKRMREEHKEREIEIRNQWLDHRKRSIEIFGSDSHIGLYPFSGMCGYFIPILKHPSYQGFMDWLVERNT